MSQARRLSDALGRANATTAIVALLESYPTGIGVIELADRMGGDRGMGVWMAMHLRDAGLAEVEEVESPIKGRTAYRVRLTSLGERVASDLARIAEYYNAPPPPTRTRADAF